MLAQRPPQRLHRQLGGVSTVATTSACSCARARPRSTAENECSLGEPTGPTYEEDLASEVAALGTLFEGPSPVYSVAASAESRLLRPRPAPGRARAPGWGRRRPSASIAATGAPTNSRVAYEGGIVEVVAVTGLRGEVSDDDLEP